MRASQVRWIRERKLDLYERLLPGRTPLRRSVNLEEDGVYLDALSEMLSLAPTGFGAMTGLRRRLADLGILGHVTLSCATLREVLDLWMIFSDNAAEPVTLSSSMTRSDGTASWSFSIRPNHIVPQATADFLIDELTASFFVFGHEMTGKRFEGFTTELPHAAIEGVNYDLILPGQVKFDQPAARITGPALALEMTVDVRRDEPLAVLVDQLGGDRGELLTIKPTTQAVYEFLIRSSTHRLTLGCAATALNLSERTLVRRLADEGTRFGAVLDDFRQRYALTLLEHGGLQAKQIAHLVGFASENGLRKAFRTWTGRPIGAWSMGREGSGQDGVLQVHRTSSSKRAY